MKKTIFAAALVLVAFPVLAQSVSPGSIQRLDLSQITLDGTVVTSTGAELNILDGVTSTAAELNILDTVTATAAELNYLDIATLGTGAASKAIVLDASGDYTYPATGTITYPSSATLTAASGSTVNVAGTFQIGGTTINATAAEINKIADDSARPVEFSAAGAQALTCAANGTGFINYFSTAAATTATLPAATGSGCIFDFTWVAAAAGAGDIIQVTGDDSINGIFFMANDTDNSVSGFETAADTDKLTFTSTTQGAAAAGAFLSLQDVSTDTFVILNSSLRGTGTEATPGATGQRP